MKRLFLNILIIFFVAGTTVLLFRFILGGDEDIWICRNGEWIRHGKPSTSKPTSSCTKNNQVKKERATPKEIAEIFYSWYLEQNTNPLTSGAYKTSGYLTDSFREKIDETLASLEQGGIDPFLCSQDKPNLISFEQQKIDGGNTTVKAIGRLGENTTAFKVLLQLVNNEWKINEVNCNAETDQQEHPKSVTTITQYFQNSGRANGLTDCGLVYGAERNIEETSGNDQIITVSLRELFKGPNTAERQGGYSSLFSSKTKDILISVKVINRMAYVNLKDFRKIIPNASASCGSAEFFAEVGETVKHYRTADKVIYAINGDPEPFYEFMQTGCSKENSYCDKKPFMN